MKKSTSLIAAGIVVIVAAAAGAIVGIGGDDDPVVEVSEPVIKVTESDYRVTPSVKEVQGGSISFVVRNDGAVEHELVIVRAGERDSLPVEGDEAVEGRGVIGEIEGIEPGRTGRATFKLTSGNYFLICNLPRHYSLGMDATLRVK